MCITFSTDDKVSDMGPLEDDKEEIRTEPFTVPSNFSWSDISLDDDEQVSCSTSYY